MIEEIEAVSSNASTVAEDWLANSDRQLRDALVGIERARTMLAGAQGHVARDLVKARQTIEDLEYKLVALEEHAKRLEIRALSAERRVSVFESQKPAGWVP
jgi:hypothetical protein